MGAGTVDSEDRNDEPGRTFELLASEYGWDHRHIRERFTFGQLQIYVDAMNARYRRANRASKPDDGFVSWESTWTQSQDIIHVTGDTHD